MCFWHSGIVCDMTQARGKGEPKNKWQSKGTTSSKQISKIIKRISKFIHYYRLTPLEVQWLPAFEALEEQASRISVFALSLCLDTERQKSTNLPNCSLALHMTLNPIYQGTAENKLAYIGESFLPSRMLKHTMQPTFAWCRKDRLKTNGNQKEQLQANRSQK